MFPSCWASLGSHCLQLSPPISVCMEPGTSKKILSPCSLILPRLDGAASRVGSYMPWSPGSSFSLNCSFRLLCKRNGYCISALILAGAVCESKLCSKTAVSSRKAGNTLQCSVWSACKQSWWHVAGNDCSIIQQQCRKVYCIWWVVLGESIARRCWGAWLSFLFCFRSETICLKQTPELLPGHWLVLPVISAVDRKEGGVFPVCLIWYS